MQKSEIPPSEFCPISGDWDKLEISHLAQMSLMICYQMLQNAGVTAFTDFELLRENQQGFFTPSPPPLPPSPQIRVNVDNSFDSFIVLTISFDNA